jgi:hypothetical protein
MTRHFIPQPRSAVISPSHTTPRFGTVSVRIRERNQNSQAHHPQKSTMFAGLPSIGPAYDQRRLAHALRSDQRVIRKMMQSCAEPARMD